MALTREVRSDDDGTARWHYTWSDTDGGTHGVIVTSKKVDGPIVMSDGTVYDATPDYVEVRYDHHEEFLAKHAELHTKAVSK